MPLPKGKLSGHSPTHYRTMKKVLISTKDIIMQIPYSEIFQTATAEFWAEQAESDPEFYLWFVAQCRAESGFNPSAVSPSGARGLMQIMPLTWREIRLRLKGIGADLHSPKDNIRAGIWYDRWCFDRFEEIPNFIDRLLISFAAYNCGPTRMRRIIDDSGAITFDVIETYIPYKETRDYVARIRRFREEFIG